MKPPRAPLPVPRPGRQRCGTRCGKGNSHTATPTSHFALTPSLGAWGSRQALSRARYTLPLLAHGRCTTRRLLVASHYEGVKDGFVSLISHVIQKSFQVRALHGGFCRLVHISTCSAGSCIQIAVSSLDTRSHPPGHAGKTLVPHETSQSKSSYHFLSSCTLTIAHAIARRTTCCSSISPV